MRVATLCHSWCATIAIYMQLSQELLFIRTYAVPRYCSSLLGSVLHSNMPRFEFAALARKCFEPWCCKLNTFIQTFGVASSTHLRRLFMAVTVSLRRGRKRELLQFSCNMKVMIVNDSTYCTGGERYSFHLTAMRAHGSFSDISIENPPVLMTLCPVLFLLLTATVFGDSVALPGVQLLGHVRLARQRSPVQRR